MTGPSLSRRRLLGLTGIGVGAGVLASCGQGSGSSGASGSASPSPSASADGVAGRTIRVATFTQNHASSPLYWPQFAPEGLTVEVQTLSSGSDMNQALERGDLDFALFGLVNGFVEAEQGLGSRIIAMGARQGAGLVVATGSGFTSGEDLRGKRIGFFGPSFQQLLLLSVLKDAGLDPEADVELVSIPYSDQPAALERGDVDAFLGSEPNPARAIAAGYGEATIDPYQTPAGDLNSAIWASRAMREEPALMGAAGQMQRDAAELLTPDGTNDREVWRDLLVDQFGYDEDVYEVVLSDVGAVWRFDEERMDQARAIGTLMQEVGLLQAEPDYDSIIDTSYLPEG